MISLRDVVTGFGNRDPLAEVWRRSLRGGGGGSAVITGVPPLRYIGDGRPLTDYLISGNTAQDGTPSADAPVDVTGSGVRTGNLWSVPIVQGAINNKGDFQNSNTRVRGEYIPVQPETQYTISCNKGIRMIYAYQNESKVGAVYDGFTQNTVVTFTTPTNCNSVCVGIMNDPNTAIITPSDIEFVMLNLGSTPLPYEPYGFKLPLTVNGTEYPIYLGTVPTTRRVKKLVLTGEERWEFYSDNNSPYGTWQFYVAGAIDGLALSSALSNIAGYGATATTRARYLYGTYLVTSGTGVAFQMAGAKDVFTGIASWKSYLSAQYAAGTPVTVWYVLTTPETAIVNEPLMKIGDYADTIRFAQAGVTIPTVNGENVLDVPTEVPPSEVTIKGGISSV